jgi:hypothetical protein
VTPLGRVWGYVGVTMVLCSRYEPWHPRRVSERQGLGPRGRRNNKDDTAHAAHGDSYADLLDIELYTRLWKALYPSAFRFPRPPLRRPFLSSLPMAKKGGGGTQVQK